MRNQLAFLFTVLSFFFLIPGVSLSMLSVTSKGSMAAKVPQVEFGFLGIPSVSGTEVKKMSIKVLDTTRSILKTVQDLWHGKYRFVAGMIFLFSVIIPALKGLLLIYLYFSNSPRVRRGILQFVKSIAKWSMCDVFVTAIFLAYLSTGAVVVRNTKETLIMGYPVRVDVLLGMDAKLQFGFWCFLAYCLLSLLALQLYVLED